MPTEGAILYDFDACPGCGQKVIKGAMRCAGCGKLLITPEEQLERIRRLKEPQKSFTLGRLLRLVLFLAVAGVAYYLFASRIAGFVHGILD